MRVSRTCLLIFLNFKFLPLLAFYEKFQKFPKIFLLMDTKLYRITLNRQNHPL